MKADIGIHFIIAIFILFESWTTAIDIPYEDLSNPYKFCPPRSSCARVDQKAAASEVIDNYDGIGGLRRNCLCDDRCGEYGDCCTDSTHFDPVEQQSSAARYGCVLTEDSGGGTYVVNRCPATWTNTRVRDACHAAAVDRDSMLGNPVTSRATGHAYRNRFCAVCNGDAADPILWDTRIVCNTLLGVAADAEQAVLDTLRYDATAGKWEVKYIGDTYNCDQIVVPPATTRIRKCLPNAVVTCHPQWPNNEIRSNCEAYTTVMYYDSLPYKNIHCAICNHVLVQNVTCQTISIHVRFPNQFAVRSFTALFVAQPGHRECRGPDMFYDPFNKTCQSLRTSVADDGVLLNCSVVAMYSAPPEGWRPPNAEAEYVTLENGTMAVCADANRPATAETLRYVVLTYVGLGVSAVLLIVHLAVFAVLPEMKNLSGKNLASFCVSLLGSYAAFLVGNWLTGPACYAGAAFTYYAFLTSFAWMLVMSFDCWRSLRLATVELRVTSGRQTKKFLVYSAVCWLVPAMMTFVAVAADVVPAVPKDVRPRFGDDQCWFGSKTALLLFFAGPLTTIMAVNVVLFGWTAYMIHSSRATVRHINTRHVRRDFRMYCRLGVLMGLTWSTGIVASYTDAKYMWMVFVVLNTFQGLFVFIAFTCRRRILDSLVRGVGGGNLGLGHLSHEKSKDGDKHSRGPPPSSFSWSSSDNGTPISSEKTTDTLY
ncbi:uncharacterized protein LOC132941171 [Metopolophium dirhodum]|uniref:uncharacterized protein LOC132941171 n=1 Tax=Metopolophium dirhodum TaxID=44670 RepID=UPI00299069B4|nr:uncharacterized protein LOC132941171 [Metopolophium dirhodum]